MIKNFLIINCTGNNNSIGLKFDNKFFTLKLQNNIKSNNLLVNNIIGFIKAVEKSILDIMPEKHSKKPTYRIEEQLQNNFIKIFYNNQQSMPKNYDSVKLLLKISGIWTSAKEYGVTFRFFFIRQ